MGALETVDEYINLLKYHGHMREKSFLEVLEEIRDDICTEHLNDDDYAYGEEEE